MIALVARFVGIGPHRGYQPTVELSLLFSIQFGVVGAKVGVGPVLKNEHGFPMQPIRRPVGRHVAAVSPDGAYFHPSHRLPHVLPRLDLSLINQDDSIRRDDLLWNGRLFGINASANPPQSGERKD